MTATVTRQDDRRQDTMPGPITASQRRALFAIGKARGLSIDDLRDLTPTGSISALTYVEASRLLNRLNAHTDHEHPHRPRRSPRRPKGVHAFTTPAQRRRIEALRIDLGWTADKLQELLSGRHQADGRPMTRLDSTTDAQAVIELLKIVLAKSEAAAGRRASVIDGPTTTQSKQDREA